MAPRQWPCSGLLTCLANQCSCAVPGADLSWHFTWWSVVTQAHVLHALALVAVALLVPCFPLAGCSRKLSIAIISANFYPFHCLIFLFLLSGLSAMCPKYKRHWPALCCVGWWGPHVPSHLSSNSYNIIACFNKYSFNEIWAIQYINNEKWFFFRLAKNEGNSVKDDTVAWLESDQWIS